MAIGEDDLALLGKLLAVALDDASAPNERELARQRSSSILARHGDAVATLLSLPGHRLQAPAPPPADHMAAWGARVRELETENADLQRDNASLQGRLGAAEAREQRLAARLGEAKKSGLVEAWIAGDHAARLPPSKDGLYPFGMLEAICVRRYGQSLGWRAAFMAAVARAEGRPFARHRFAALDREAPAVPARLIQIARTADLGKPEAVGWQSDVKQTSLAAMRQGASNNDIARLLRERHGVSASRDAVRAFRRRLARKQGTPRPAADPVQENIGG